MKSSHNPKCGRLCTKRGVPRMSPIFFFSSSSSCARRRFSFNQDNTIGASGRNWLSEVVSLEITASTALGTICVKYGPNQPNVSSTERKVTSENDLLHQCLPMHTKVTRGIGRCTWAVWISSNMLFAGTTAHGWTRQEYTDLGVWKDRKSTPTHESIPEFAPRSARRIVPTNVWLVETRTL
jgi:hypothetical protein